MKVYPRNSIAGARTPYEMPPEDAAAIVGAAALAQAIAPPRSGLAEIDQAEELFEAEQVSFAAETAKAEAAAKAVSAHRDRSNKAIWARQAQIDLLTAARKEFTSALSAGEDTTAVTLRMSDAQAKIDAYTSVSESSLKNAQLAQLSESGLQQQLIMAKTRLNNAEAMVLLKQYVEALVPLIPLAREITRLAPQLVSTDRPGYLINVRHAKIGNFTIHDNGSMSFQLG